MQKHTSCFLRMFFFQLMSAIKSGAVGSSHFAKAARINDIKKHLPPERSGGGV